MIAARIIGKISTARILGGVLLVVAILIALLLLSRCTNAELQREIGALSQRGEQCREDNRHQTEQLDDCVQGFTALADRLRLEQDAAARAVLAAERRDRERERDLQSEQDERARIYAENPDCESWSRIPVCADIEQRMQVRRRALIDRWKEEGNE